MPHRKVHMWLTLAGLTGIVSLFLPFTFDISPLMALKEGGFFSLMRFAAPAFLSIFIFLSAINLIISGSFFKTGRVIAYLISVVSACNTISVFFTGGAFPTELIERLSFALVVVLLVSGSWLVISKLKQGATADYYPIIALQVAYLANCLMCLLLFPTVYGWQIGAWFILATVVIYLFQIFLFATQRDTTPDRGHEKEIRN